MNAAPCYNLLPMLLGLIFIVAAALLAYFWVEAFVVTLKGALILSLFFWGLITFLIGLSRRKAKHDYANALRDETGDESP